MAIVPDKAGPGFSVDRPLGKSYNLVSTKSFAITPSDTVNFPRVPREIQVAVGGTVTVVNMDDTTTQYTVPAGGVITQMTKRVNATGTAATGLVGVL